MNGRIPAEISQQVAEACNLLSRHLASTLRAVYLYGSALGGGLKPYSDVDLLVVADAELGEDLRRRLLLDLLKVSALPGEDEAVRALEVTVVVYHEVMPWRYPARRELQFGEWLRKDLLAGFFEPPVKDVDLAILLTQARERSLALIGPAAVECFEPIPPRDLFRAFAATLKQWKSPSDWEGDERNVVLTLARLWYSTVTGRLVPKEVAADWVLERLPAEHQSILLDARRTYLGLAGDDPASNPGRTTRFVRFVGSHLADLIEARVT